MAWETRVKLVLTDQIPLQEVLWCLLAAARLATWGPFSVRLTFVPAVLCMQSAMVVYLFRAVLDMSR